MTRDVYVALAAWLGVMGGGTLIACICFAIAAAVNSSDRNEAAGELIWKITRYFGVMSVGFWASAAAIIFWYK